MTRILSKINKICHVLLIVSHMLCLACMFSTRVERSIKSSFNGFLLKMLRSSVVEITCVCIEATWLSGKGVDF